MLKLWDFQKLADFLSFNAFPPLSTRAVHDKNSIQCTNKLLVKEAVISIDFTPYRYSTQIA